MMVGQVLDLVILVPNITSRFEATTKKERLKEIQEEFESLIDKFNK